MDNYRYVSEYHLTSPYYRHTTTNLGKPNYTIGQWIGCEDQSVIAKARLSVKVAYFASIIGKIAGYCFMKKIMELKSRQVNLLIGGNGFL